MADYISASNVQAFYPGVTFSATTVPSTTQVETYIDQVESEINAILASLGFTIPVTATRAVKVLRHLGLPGVLVSVTFAGSARPGTLSGNQTSSRETDLRRHYSDNKKMLKEEGVRILIDAGVTHPTDEILNHAPALVTSAADVLADSQTWYERTRFKDHVDTRIRSKIRL